MNIKEIYYNNKIYTVPTTSVKHIDNSDVTQIEEDLIVYYSDQHQAWREASLDLQKMYTNKVVVNVLSGDETLKLKVNADDVIEILDKKVVKVKLESIVVCDDDVKNIWKVVDQSNDLCKLYKIFDQNKHRLSAENKIFNG